MRIIRARSIYYCLVFGLVAWSINFFRLLYLTQQTSNHHPDEASLPQLLFRVGRSERTATKPSTYFCSKSIQRNTFNNTPPQNHRRTFLWGIPTYDSDTEKQRRQTIRETYLSFFRQQQQDSGSHTPHRICSLSELTCQASLRSHCQLVYTFFMGANPKGPPELLEGQDFRAMMTQEPTIKGDIELDVVYLDIRENQFDG